MPVSSWQPTGLLVRTPGYWFGYQSMVAGAGLPGVTGARSFVNLYNTATSGVSLIVQGLTLHTQDTDTDAQLAFAQGNPGVIAPNPPVATDPSRPPGPGGLNIFNNVTFIGNRFAILPLTNGGWNWNHDYPLCWIPAGYSLIVGTDAQDTGLYATFHYWWTQYPY